VINGLAKIFGFGGESVFCQLWQSLAWAQSDFPGKPVKIVVPFPPGGGADIIARMIGAKLSEKWKQPVIVDNRAGASGNIGAEFVSKQPADGYTLLLTSAPLAIAPAVFKQLAFDPVKSFTPITQIATVPLVLVTRADSPINNMEELIALARQDGTKVTFGSFGNGSPAHLVGERINQIAHLKMTHVPYKGSSAALPDVLSGQLTFAVLDAISITPLIKSGSCERLPSWVSSVPPPCLTSPRLYRRAFRLKPSVGMPYSHPQVCRYLLLNN